jgi:hypothetical protein
VPRISGIMRAAARLGDRENHQNFRRLIRRFKRRPTLVLSGLRYRQFPRNYYTLL